MRLRSGWLLLFAPLTLNALACADTEDRKNTNSRAGADSGGDDSGGTASGGTKANGGTKADGGTDAEGGSEAGGGTEASGGAEASAGATSGGENAGGAPGNDAGAGGGGTADECGAPTELAILGNYVEPNGDLLWLRDSGKAVTLTRVKAGAPSVAKLPSLWRVERVCAKNSVLVLKNGAGAFTRLDYLKGASSLTVCLSNQTAATEPLAVALPAANRTNTIDSGCNDGPWIRLAKGGN